MPTPRALDPGLNPTGADTPASDARVGALLAAYAQGYFPMADAKTGALSFYTADPRAVIGLEPGGMHVARSLRKRLRSGRFTITADAAFARVVRECAAPRPGREETWISPELIDLYDHMHALGHAHSVEAWLAVEDVPAGQSVPPGAVHEFPEGPRVLVGGVYGTAVGAAFFAESKFSRPEWGGTDASKVALVHLVEHVRRRGYAILDVQFWNPHTDQFGLQEVSHKEFLRRLMTAVRKNVEWSPFHPAIPETPPFTG
jgi:leucyl/phenylalanyl-tRNA--protein transferase